MLPLIKFGVEGRKRTRGHLKKENDREIMKDQEGGGRGELILTNQLLR